MFNAQVSVRKRADGWAWPQGNGVWGVSRRVREGRRAVRVREITQEVPLPGTGVRGGSPSEKGQAEPLDGLLTI